MFCWLHKYTFDQHFILRFSWCGCADAWVGLQFCLHLSLRVKTLYLCHKRMQREGRTELTEQRKRGLRNRDELMRRGEEERLWQCPKPFTIHPSSLICLSFQSVDLMSSENYPTYTVFTFLSCELLKQSNVHSQPLTGCRCLLAATSSTKKCHIWVLKRKDYPVITRKRQKLQSLRFIFQPLVGFPTWRLVTSPL